MPRLGHLIFHLHAGNLEELDLGRAPMLTSRPLAALRKGLPRLRRLSLSRAKLRAPDGLAPPAAWGCAALEQLSLSRCVLAPV